MCFTHTRLQINDVTVVLFVLFWVPPVLNPLENLHLVLVRLDRVEMLIACWQRLVNDRRFGLRVHCRGGLFCLRLLILLLFLNHLE
jgi:hypothetical protein